MTDFTSEVRNRSLQEPADAPTARESKSPPRDPGESLLARLRLSRSAETSPLPVLIGLVAVWIFFQVENSTFLTARNLSNLTTQMAVMAILAMAVVLVLVAGEIDLSLGSITGVTSAVLGALITTDHWAGGVALVIVLLIGLGIGLLQGVVTVLVGVPSFLVTLGGFLAWAGVQLSVIGPAGDLPVTNGVVTSIGNDYLASWVAWLLAVMAVATLAAVEIGRHRASQRASTEAGPIASRIVRVGLVAAGLAALVAYLNNSFGVPDVLVLMLGLATCLGWILRRTIFGRHIYAVGGNVEASRRAGVPVGAVRIAVLGLSGLLGAVAGIVSTSNLFATSAGVGGSTLLLEAIAAAVIGGTSLFGGRGRVYQALLGSLVIASIVNGLDLLGQAASTEEVATGVILVLAVSLDAMNRRRRSAAGH